jgi:hypothetical protein
MAFRSHLSQDGFRSSHYIGVIMFSWLAAIGVDWSEGYLDPPLDASEASATCQVLSLHEHFKTFISFSRIKGNELGQ